MFPMEFVLSEKYSPEFIPEWNCTNFSMGHAPSKLISALKLKTENPYRHNFQQLTPEK